MKKIFLIILLFLVFMMPSFAKQQENNQKYIKNNLTYLNLEWWQNYNDEILIEHLKKLFESNYDLKNALLKVKESEKLAKIQLINELPSLRTDSFVSRDFRSSVQRFGDMEIPNFSQSNFQFPLTMSYEVDIWGKNRLKTKSAKKDLEIVNQAQRASYIRITSEFCALYFNLIKTDKLLEIQNELINIQSEIVKKVELKNEAGLCPIEDVLNEQKYLTVLKEEKNNLEEKQDVIINNLKVYLTTDSAIKRNSYEGVIIPDKIPLEISSEIIEKRPDYIQQEANIERAGYDVKIARREMLPQFVIFGQIGLNAYRLSNLFNTPSHLANAGVMPSFDFFFAGRKLNFLQFKKYQYEEAINNYRKTILEDIKEVNLGLFGYKTAVKNYEESVERLKRQNKIFSLLKDKKSIGSASDLDILYGKEADLTVKKEEVSNKINCLISTISLYKSVGGINLYKLTEDI